MAEYIEREAVLEILRGWSAPWDGYQKVKELPAADVRPVVTCGECKYWEISKIEPPFHVCTYVCGATFVRSAGDFCSRGEKREE